MPLSLEDQPYFAGFRVLSTNGIDLPVLGVFRLLGLMRGRRVALTSTADRGVDSLRPHGAPRGPGISALASLDARSLSILAWHYHDVDLPGEPAAVALSVRGLPSGAAAVRAEHFRIDVNHGNAYSEWKKTGSPGRPTAEQIAALKQAATLKQIDAPTHHAGSRGGFSCEFLLPRQAVSLIVLSW